MAADLLVLDVGSDGAVGVELGHVRHGGRLCLPGGFHVVERLEPPRLQEGCQITRNPKRQLEKNGFLVDLWYAARRSPPPPRPPSRSRTP